MKIGIITMYYNNANYGGLLQAYALQKTITNLGSECEQISYDFYRDSCGDTSIIYTLRKLKHFIYSWISPFCKRNKVYKNALKEFEKCIPHSKVVYSGNISKIENNYDFFVCGSDQIWNPVWWNDIFLLYFTNKNKISYAASMAVDKLTECELTYFHERIKDFRNISVREKVTVEYLQKIKAIQSELVPDPTLLLTKQDWESMIFKKKREGKPYIFAYFLGFDEKQRKMCIEFAHNNNLDIFFVPYIFENSFNWDVSNSAYHMDDYSVSSFLETIRNASLIITDSFHGTVFSCIFERPFYVMERKLNGKEKRMNSRIESLFYELGISDSRIVSSLDGLNISEYNDYEVMKMRNKIQEWREKGIKYLRDNLV